MKIRSYIHRSRATWSLHESKVERADLIRGALWLGDVMKSDAPVFDVPEGPVEYAIHELAHGFTLGLLPDFADTYPWANFNLRSYVADLSDKISVHFSSLPAAPGVVNEALTWAYEIQVLKRIGLLRGRPFFVGDCLSTAASVGASESLVRTMRQQLSDDETVARYIMTILVHAADERKKHAQRRKR